MDSKIEVALFRRKNNSGFLKVKLRSHMKPGLISFKDIELDSVGNKTEMARAVEIAGGALAEYQDEQYGDRHDPSDCAKLAKETFEELWAELEQGSSSVH